MIVYRAIIGLVFIFLTAFCFAEEKEERTYHDFSHIPVLDEGRVKPIYTFAQSYLTRFSGRKRLKDISANAWLAEILFDQRNAYHRPVFRVRNQGVRRAVGLSPERKSGLYSFLEVTQAMHKHLDLIQELKKLSSEDLSLEQRKVLMLYHHTLDYYDLSRSFSLVLPYFRISDSTLARQLDLEKDTLYTYLEFLGREKKIAELWHRFQTENKNKTGFTETQKALIDLKEKTFIFSHDRLTRLFKIFPPQWQKDQDRWFSPWEIIEKGSGSPQTAHALSLWKQLAESYRLQKAQNWNKITKDIRQFSYKKALHHVQEDKISLEVLYNRVDFFSGSLMVYFLCFVLLIFSFLFWHKFLYISAFLSGFFAFLLQGLGIVFRIILLERPPVSTLYESILFVSWIAVFLTLLLEGKRRDRFLLFFGSLAGIILQWIALHYAGKGDTLVVLRAVLETNFWLATHVIMITIGYACCLLVGGLAHIELIRKAFFRYSNTLNMYPYILACLLIALFFSMAGTILGGIWADQSWGRFWGWDPKENGALLIVLWLVFILHGRLSGVLNRLFFTISAAFTNLVVVLSWFGVNVLNVGLHTYGATHNIMFNIGLFMIIETGFILIMSGIIQYQKKMEKINEK